MDSATFIKTIVKDILNKPLSSDRNIEYGGSYNTIKQAFLRNNKIGECVSTMISNMIIKELFDFKKDEAIIFLKSFLTHSELKEFEHIKYNSSNIKKLVFFVSKKINNEKIPRNKNNKEDIQIYSLNELRKDGWNEEKFARAMLEIFYKTVGEDFENVAQPNALMAIVNDQINSNKIMLNHENEVIGCWSYIPLNSELFEKDKKGELQVSDIIPLKMPYLWEGVYNMHFGAICLRDDYKYTKGFSRLLFSILDSIEQLAINGVFINEVVAKACSDSGIKFSEGIGLNYIKEHINGDGKIYHAKFIDIIDHSVMKKYRTLNSLYKSKFKNEKFRV